MTERPSKDVMASVGGVRGEIHSRWNFVFKVTPCTAEMVLGNVLVVSREYPVTDAAKVAEVDENTAVNVYRWLKEVGSTKLL